MTDPAYILSEPDDYGIYIKLGPTEPPHHQRANPTDDEHDPAQVIGNAKAGRPLFNTEALTGPQGGAWLGGDPVAVHPPFAGRPAFESAEAEARAILGRYLDVPTCPNCGVAAGVDVWGEEPIQFDGSVRRYPLMVFPIKHRYPTSVTPTSQHDVCDGPAGLDEVTT